MVAKGFEEGAVVAPNGEAVMLVANGLLLAAWTANGDAVTFVAKGLELTVVDPNELANGEVDPKFTLMAFGFSVRGEAGNSIWGCGFGAPNGEADRVPAEVLNGTLEMVVANGLLVTGAGLCGAPNGLAVKGDRTGCAVGCVNGELVMNGLGLLVVEPPLDWNVANPKLLLA